MRDAAAPALTRLELIVAGLWLMLWAAINTGPGVLESEPAGLVGTLHFLRTAFPLLTGLAVVLLLLGDASMDPREVPPLATSLKLWGIYGLLGLAAATTSDHAWHASYWSACYLATIGVVLLLLRTEGRDRVRLALRRFNYFTWALVGAYLLVLLVVARDQLIVETEFGYSGYGVIGRIGTVAGAIVPRASGFSRFAAIPGVIAFVAAVATRGGTRLLWAVVAVVCAAIVWFMQSRGSLVGLVAAMGFATFFLSRRTRWLGLALLVVLVVIFATEVVPATTKEGLALHITRAQSAEELQSMTGRTRAWTRALEHVEASPIWGYGPQADRYLLREHVHNSYLYVLLQSGIPGLIVWVAGLVLAWIHFFRRWASEEGQTRRERMFLVQLGSMLAFFTVRSIPEASGALFGIDFLVMVPAMAYLGLPASAPEGVIRTPAYEDGS